MKNYLADADIVKLPAPSGGAVSGQFILVGLLAGVAQVDAAAGVLVPCVREGMFALPKATGAAWAKGDRLYWDATAGNFTKTSTSNTAIGKAGEDQVSGDAIGAVILDPIV